MDELGEKLRRVVEGSTTPITMSEIVELAEKNSAFKATVERTTGAGKSRGLTWRRSVRAGLVVAVSAMVLGAFVVARSTDTVQNRRSSGPNHRVVRSKWQLTASLTGPQFVLATGNPEAVVGVVCNHLPTCLLSTGYGSGGAAANVGSTYVSADGGHAWEPSDLPSDVTTTTLASCATTTWCAAGGGLLDYSTGDPAAKKPSRDPELLISTDAGHTWTTKAVPIPVDVEQLPAYGQLPAETTYWPGVIDAVSCSAPGVCNVIGSTGVNNSDGGPSDEVVFLSTSDGGGHWTSTVLPERSSERSLQLIEFGGASVSMSCATRTHCVAVASFYGLVPNQGVVDAWVTTNRGTTWAEHQIQGITGMTPEISCPQVTICWAGPTSYASTYPVGAVARSVDGGTTWTLVPLPTPTSSAAVVHGSSWQSISCVSGTTCYLGGDGIDETTDGGGSWQAVALPPQVGAVAGISCEPGGSCAAVANPVSVGADFIQGGSVVLTNASDPSAPTGSSATAGSTPDSSGVQATPESILVK
jgi:hypothetical protein